jgi:hypothetical protein
MVDAVPNIAEKQEVVYLDNVMISEPQYLTITERVDPSLLEFLGDLSFESLGGQELINISRHDLVNGQKTLYSPIKNLSSIRSQYNPSNIVALQGSSDVTFKSFAIRFEDYVLEVGLGPNGEVIYVDDNGNIIINFINVPENQEVEVQILKKGTELNDTTYEIVTGFVDGGSFNSLQGTSIDGGNPLTTDWELTYNGGLATDSFN